MELTIDFIKKSWNEFNEQYFQGKLKEPEFKISRSKHTLGLYHYEIKLGHLYDRISISNYYNCGEFEYKNTLLHEMIHQHIRQNNLEPRSVHHGRVFHSLANKFNMEGGWQISVTNSREGFVPKNKVQETYHLCAFKDSKGKYFLFKYNDNYYYKMVGKINRNRWKDAIWFDSKDAEKYDNMVKCRETIRGRFISKDEYDKLVKETQLSVRRAV